MKIAKSKKLKTKYIVLILVNLLVIAGAAWVIYDRFFSKPSANEPVSQQIESIANVETIVFIGDYTTAFGGEQSALNRLRENHPDISFVSINLAKESLTSKAANEMLNDELIKDLTNIQADTFFVSLGANDAIEKIPSETYIENINSIVEKLSPTNAKVLLNCPPLINDGKNNTDGLVLMYCQALGKIKADRVIFGDESAYATFKDSTNALLSSDGIHPNDAGYQKLGELWAGAYQKTVGN
jgi:lysophospholipase L1-like esterase